MNDSQKLFETCQKTLEKEDICCTCLKKTAFTIKITDLDYDGRTFHEKLIACVSPTLEVDRQNTPRICQICTTTLNLAFKFRKTALNSLRSLEYIVEQVIQYDDEEVEEVKEENDFSDDHMSFSNIGEFENDELDKAVLLITDIAKQTSDCNSVELYCKECSLMFQVNNEYEEHMVKVHNKKVECELCGKTFKTLFRLKVHAASHGREKSYNCTNCSKTFSRLSSLKRHMTGHYAPPGQKSKKTPFLCTICGKNFPFSNGAARHMRIHFGIRTHKCQICHKQFSQSTHLHVHMRTHSGEKPYVCEHCGDSFTLKAGLVKHLKAKHKQEERNKLLTEDVSFN